MNPASLENRYRLRAGIRVRREEFGALLYDADSEALYVIRPPAATALLASLDGCADLGTIVKAIYGNEGAASQALALVAQLLEWGALDEV